MSLTITGTITGAAMTGLTSPTYGIVSDSSNNNIRTWAVATLGGTQTGVAAHSTSNPFTIQWIRPASIKQLGTPNPSNGRYPRIPQNVYRLKVVKGIVPAVNQPAQHCHFGLDLPMPAGADTYDRASAVAVISLLAGLFASQSFRDGLVDTMITGIQ